MIAKEVRFHCHGLLGRGSATAEEVDVTNNRAPPPRSRTGWGFCNHREAT